VLTLIMQFVELHFCIVCYTDVFHSAAEISRLLGNNQSLLPDTDEENESFENKEDDFYGEEKIDICD
ncbi:MAG: hypothetical protein ACI4EO_10490, partial [Blautia sp.]